MKHRRLLRWSTPLLALVLLAGACGDDDDDSSADTTPAQTTTFPPSAELTELCGLAQEMYDSEDFPTADQIEKYKELAPDELQDAIKVAGDAVIDAGDDTVKFFVNISDDDVAAATDEIDAFEEANCGIPHSEDNALPVGATHEEEDDAEKVEVTATEYDFAYDDSIKPGRTTFVLTNDGEEAHYLGVAKLKEGVAFDEALEAEDPSTVIDSEWDTNIAAPGGDDEELVTFDLESGTYALVCFLPAADGTPHAFLGMAKELTVS